MHGHLFKYKNKQMIFVVFSNLFDSMLGMMHMKFKRHFVIILQSASGIADATYKNLAITQLTVQVQQQQLYLWYMVILGGGIGSPLLFSQSVSSVETSYSK